MLYTLSNTKFTLQTGSTMTLLFLSCLTLKMSILPEWYQVYGQSSFRLNDTHLSHCCTGIGEHRQGTT